MYSPWKTASRHGTSSLFSPSEVRDDDALQANS